MLPPPPRDVLRDCLRDTPIEIAWIRAGVTFCVTSVLLTASSRKSGANLKCSLECRLNCYMEQVKSCQLLVVNCDNTRQIPFSFRFIYARWGGLLCLQTSESFQFLLHHKRLRRDFGWCNCSLHLATCITLFAISEPNEKLPKFCAQIVANIPCTLPSHLRIHMYVDIFRSSKLEAATRCHTPRAICRGDKKRAKIPRPIQTEWGRSASMLQCRE